MYKTNFIPAAEYDHLCIPCQKKLAQITQAFESHVDNMPDQASSDDEFPCNWMYTYKKFCGGYTCVNGGNENG